MNFRLSTTLICTLSLVLATSVAAFGAGITLQPDEANSKDTFVYSFLPVTNIGGSATFLSAGNSPLVGPPGGQSEHDLNTLIQFDLSAVSYTAGAVTSATLNLFLIDSAAFNPNVASPSPTKPVDLSLHEITESWSETTTWSTKPTFNEAAEDLATVTGIDQWVSLDVTDLVKDWLNNPASNNGMLIQQTNFEATGMLFHVAVFNSSGGATTELRPFLNIVPEPSGGVLALTGLLALVVRRRVRDGWSAVALDLPAAPTLRRAVR